VLKIDVSTTIQFLMPFYFIMKPELLSVLENHQAFQQTNLIRVLRQSVRLITNEISKTLVLQGHGNLSARHLNVFENLAVSDNNIMSLANRAGISKQAMSKLVKEIAVEGYVNVITDKRDNRVQIVQLTDKGGDFLLFLEKEIKSKYQEILNLGLTQKEDLEQVFRTLKSLSGYVETKSNKKTDKSVVSDLPA
jgi:DNA-binding MarR family transcriptional regulator